MSCTTKTQSTKSIDEIPFTNNWFERTLPIWDQYVADLNVDAYLEIGVNEGRSMRWVLEHLKPSLAVGVDAWRDPKNKKHGVYEQCKKNCEANLKDWVESDVVRLYQQWSQDFFADHHHEYRRAFDLAYIDGGHDAYDCMADMLQAYEMLKVKTHKMQLSTLDKKGRNKIEQDVGGIMVVDDLHRIWHYGKPLVRIAVHQFELLMHGRMFKIWQDGRQCGFVRIS